MEELKRKIDIKIADWFKLSSKKALLLTGVRQSGKTFAIRKFAKSNNVNLVELNIATYPNLLNLLKSAENAEDLLLKISQYIPIDYIPQNTIIFFDEIQDFPELATQIKFLVDKTNYHYALSGSLLGVALKKVRSVPVGYVIEHQVYPLDFEEFLWALNIPNIDYIRKCFETKTKIDDSIHEYFIDLVRKYQIVGGMPDVVKSFVENKNLNEVKMIQKSIINLYYNDFTKSIEKNVIKTYELIPQFLAKENKKFIISDLSESKTRYDYQEKGFDWLIHSGTVIPCKKVRIAKVPLYNYAVNSYFKLYLSDVGLLNNIYGEATINAILTNSDFVNKGAMYENFVAQELFASDNRLYYFNKNNVGEVDFVIEKDNGICLIEVKSGKDYYVHQALNNLSAILEYNIKSKYVLSFNNIEEKDGIIYLPIYLTMFL